MKNISTTNVYKQSVLYYTSVCSLFIKTTVTIITFTKCNLNVLNKCF